MFQEVTVDRFEVIKVLTNDQNLVREWKKLFLELGLHDEDLYEFEKSFRSYEPVEDTFTSIIELWKSKDAKRTSNSNYWDHLIKTLDKLGYTKVVEELEEIAKKSSKTAFLNEPECIDVKILHIQDKTIGYTYETIFGPYLDSSVRIITLQDPNIQSSYQLNNLENMITLLLDKCVNLAKIHLISSFDDRKGKIGIRKFQMESLANLSTRLKYLKRPVPAQLIVTYDQSLREGLLQLHNGWSFHLERGLDIFYLYDKDSDQWKNFENRKCKSTKIYCARKIVW